MIFLKASYLAIRVFLVLVCALWVLILVEILPAFLMTGIAGVRGKLVHIWSMGKVNPDLPWSCQDSLQLIHEGYTDLFVFVLLTWALLELKRFLDRRFFSLSRPERETPTASIQSQGVDSESGSL